MKVVSAAEMRAIERRSEALGVSLERLMENAGRAVAKEVSELLGDRLAVSKVVLLVGPGNNGGDGLVAGRYLHDWGVRVTVVVWSRKLQNDHNFDRLVARGIATVSSDDPPDMARIDDALAESDVVVDALFGIGKIRHISGGLEDILARIAMEKKKRPSLLMVAVDLPSGLDADTGSVDPATLAADVTVTFGHPKLGAFQFPGAGMLGKLQVADIGIPEDIAADISVETITNEWVKAILPARPANANKGTFGKVLVVGGSSNYIGAPCLAATGAMRVGAGLVTMAVPKSILPIVASKLTETTFLSLAEAEPGVIGPEAVGQLSEAAAEYDAFLIGPGIGRASSTVSFLKRFLLGNTSLARCKMVVDADALYALSKSFDWWRSVAANLVVTPHSGEMARLTGKTIEEIESDRIGYASRCAADWRVVVVLKGAHTIIAAPQRTIGISTFANPVLATAGTGDILSGMVAGFMAQGLDPYAAARCATYIHGQTAETVRQEIGEAGAIAGDLLARIPRRILAAKA